MDRRNAGIWLTAGSAIWDSVAGIADDCRGGDPCTETITARELVRSATSVGEDGYTRTAPSRMRPGWSAGPGRVRHHAAIAMRLAPAPKGAGLTGHIAGHRNDIRIGPG